MNINRSESDFISKMRGDMEQLDKKFQELLRDTGAYKGLSLELPAYSWQKALSEYRNYAANLLLVFDNKGAENSLLLSHIPIITPRGTFVIEGRERVPKAELIPKDLKKGYKMSEAVAVRDLSAFILKQADATTYIKRYFEAVTKSIEKEKNKKKFFEIPEMFTLGTDAFIKKCFNSMSGIENFPFMDSTNPLSEVCHLRKVSFWGKSKSKRGRDIHPSHYGRLCVIETPESEKIGMRLHLAHKAEIDTANKIILAPLIDLKTNKTVKAQPADDSVVADRQAVPEGNVLARGGKDGKYVDASEIGYRDAFVDQMFGYAALQVPFINHNDPARSLMGAKNLKQAVPVKNPEAPIVATTYENEVAEISGRIVRLDVDGEVANVSKDEILIKNISGEEKVYSLINDIPSIASKSAVFQVPKVKVGNMVEKGQIIAEGAGIKDGGLALGANFLVAYMPFKGYNMDDGIVVSKGTAEKLTSIHIEEFEIRLEDGDIPTWLPMEGLKLSKDTPVLILKRKAKDIRHMAKEWMIGGIVRNAIVEMGAIKIWIKRERPLEVGDKIMGRHGNKGIVAAILPQGEMPFFEINKDGKKEKRQIDIMLNPHSVITRMNIGQIYETHFGWLAMEHPDESVRNMARISGKPFYEKDLNKLSTWLKKSGLDDKGCIKVHYKEDGEDKLTLNPVTVGYQYIVKLNHLAVNKMSVRGGKGPVSFITGMPLSGRKTEGGQRVGEMEVWALLAHNADQIVKEMLGEKSNAHVQGTGAVSISDSLKTLIFYLRGLGIHFEFMDKNDEVIEPEDFDKSKRRLLEKYRVRWANDSMMMSWGRHLHIPKKSKIEKLKDFFERKEKEMETRNGAKEILNLNDFESEYKDEMGYISLREPVTLIKREVSILPLLPLRCRPNPDSKINKLYKKIYLNNVLIKKMNKTDEGYKKIERRIQKTVDKLEEELSRYVKGKKGIIRKAILGKRVNFSARAVIIPNPDLQADVAEIPVKIMDELGIKEGDKVLLNRQPSLHIHNIQVFKAKKGRGNAIGINPLVCSGFNADFDGDTMAIYKTEGKKIPESMSVSEQIILAANGKLNLSLSQDITSGIYFATGNKKGREEFNELIKDNRLDIPMAGRIDKDTLTKGIFKYYLKTNDRLATLRLAEEVERFGLRWATFSGLSFSVFDLKELTLGNAEKTGFEYKTDDELNKRLEDALFSKLKDNADNPISIMVVSGGRGDKGQIRQMVARKGLIDRMGGKKTTVPVDSNYLEGLSPTEYYMACYGARNSLGDKKLLTPECGYLTRRLVFAAFDTIISEDNCGVSEGVAFEEIENVLGRNTLNAVVLNDNERIPENTTINEELLEKLKIAGLKEIKVRSPIICKSAKGICRKCYGWDLARKAEPPINFKAGIIAAEVIGERATQDAMRTYHKGTATGTVKLFDKVKAIFDNLEDPETKKRVAETIKSIDDLPVLAKELHNYYERKVDLKHYEVILKALFIDNTYKGTKKAIEKKPVLYRASFEGALGVLGEAALTGEISPIQGAIENLFI